MLIKQRNHAGDRISRTQNRFVVNHHRQGVNLRANKQYDAKPVSGQQQGTGCHQPSKGAGSAAGKNHPPNHP